MGPRKRLVFSTLATALLVFAMATLFQSIRKNTPVMIQTAGFPTTGNTSAPIEIVLIEDFQCKNCRLFSQKIIPKIQSHYIKPGKARFTLVPVSFLAGSQIIANAALEVYRQAPNQFFVYLKSIIEYDGEIKPIDLIRIARRMGGNIDISKLEQCISKKCHQEELDRNLSWAIGIMGNQFRTPALFINGVPGSTYSFEAIQYQVEQILSNPQ